MAYKQFDLDEVGTITIYKRRGSRSVRLSVGADGRIRMTMPTYVPYQTAIAFARSRKQWLLSQTEARQHGLENSQPIGKKHRLVFTASFNAAKPSSRIKGADVLVQYPASLSPNDASVQKTATNAAVRALRDEAEETLPKHLARLASDHGFEYKSVVVKRLKGRWGSCDHNGNIVLNLFLMQLPWELIEYVMLHELIHTKHLDHGTDFWATFLAHNPAAKQLRKQIKQYQPNFVLP